MTHSPELRLWLDCGAHGRVELSRVTPKSVVAKERRAVPPGPADLVVCIDGQCSRTRVRLSRGFADGRRVALIRPLISS